MNDDLISRQAAIEEVEFGITYVKAFNMETGEVREPFKASNEELKKAVERIKALPAAESERKAPMSYKEQLSLDCDFCRQHECGDKLYESSDWDGGIGFDYIRDIRFCPICGRELYNGG